MAPYRLQRVKVWLDPWSDEANTGYQMVQSLMSIGSGGLTGLPWGQGSGKFFYLPEAHTDFAFAIFCQEWGLLGAAILISVFVLLAAAFFRIAMNTKDERGFILVSGVNRRAFVLYQLWRYFDADNSGFDRTGAFSLSRRV